MTKFFTNKILQTNKLIAFLSILLVLSNVFFINVFAGNKLDLSLFTIKKDNANAQNGDVEVQPGENIHILLSGKNSGDALTNVKAEFSFSSNNFTYTNQNKINSYKNWTIENKNIDTNTFHPPLLNIAPIATDAPTGTFLDLYYLDLKINQDTPDTILTLGAQYISDLTSSLVLNRNVYINSRPHIVDYSFEKAGVNTSSLQRGGDQADFVVKIKDYNGCSNIDSANVKADLSKLRLSNNESLTFVSCDQNIAIYKKTNITTLLSPQTIVFSHSDFSVSDENGLTNLPNDPNTSFDDEDKKDPLSLEIATAGNPTVYLSSMRNYVGTGILNNFVVLTFTGSQNGATKVTLGGDATCNGTNIQDWTPGYTANTGSTLIIPSTTLQEGINTIYLCLKNDEGKIGSANININKDLTAPIITSVSFSPADVVNNNSGVKFICNEDGIYQIEKTNAGTTNTVILTGSVVANANNSVSIPNSDLSIGTNDISVYCLDRALNFSYKNGTISKTTPPPSFANKVLSFADNDIDFDGINGKDISLTWDNTSAITYPYFESYRIYILPSNITLDKNTHTYVKLLTSKNLTNFIGDENIINDSLGNPFVSGGSYKACISIMGTNGILGDEGCSSVSILSSDNVAHPKILDARFTSNTNLEVTTDATLDNNLANHSGSLFTFNYNGSSYQAISITSIDSDKINLQIPALNNIAAIGTNVTASTGAIRAKGGGFNNVSTLANIKDAQVPTINNFLKITSSLYDNFYSGSIVFSYNFGENMKNSFTKFQFVREGGNPDSNTYTFPITGNNLNAGINTLGIDLKTIGLRDGVYYKTRIIAQDIAGNDTQSNYLNDIRFDSKGPNEVTKNITDLYNTTTPLLSWNIPMDNNGNGSGVKSYKLSLYSGKTCEGTALQEYSVIGTNKTLASLQDIGDYSWKIIAIDYLGNLSESTKCDFFRVDTRKPSFSNIQIKDLALLSTQYLKKGDTIEISASITNTDINHIWGDFSLLTGKNTDTHVLCAAPSTGISCSYNAGNVIYSFPAGNISDGTKQISMIAQNLSGGNDTTETQNSIADSSLPILSNDALITPTGIIGGTGATIKWNTNKISDSIGLSTIKIEYKNTGTWATLGTTPNNGSFLWDLTNIPSGTGYSIKMTAYDNAGNQTSAVFQDFIIDRTIPAVMASTIYAPNGGEILAGGTNINIQWAPGLITDSTLKTNPISLYYSIDNGTSFIMIDDNLPNSGTYTWKIPEIDSTQVKIKLVAQDSVGNIGFDVSDSSFIVDSTKPELTFSYPTTPPNGSFINNSGIEISGITSDQYFKNVSYSFQDKTNATFYNGVSFTGTQTWIEICNDAVIGGSNDACKNIHFTLNSNILDTHKYALILKSKDEAGNETLSIPLDYTGDNTGPSLVPSTLSGTFFQNTITLSGTSTDSGAGVASVKLQIKKGALYFDGTNFVPTIQYLNTNTTDSYKHWSYDFNNQGEDSAFDIIITAYDASYKINNTTSQTIIINKDSIKPNIIGSENLFSSPLANSIHIGGTIIPITWNNNSITDTGAGLKTNPIKLEYFDGTQWKLIVDNKTNDGSYNWTTPLLDEKNVKIRLTAEDAVGNTQSQLSSAFIVDSTPPSIQKIETMDMDTDGKIDALNITFSEPIKDSSIQLANFSIGGGIGIPTSWETGIASDDENFILKFSNTGDTSTTPSLSYTKGTLTDMAGKFLENVVSKASIDTTVPRLLEIDALDNDGNGKIDTLKLIFSENISSTNTKIPFSLSNIGNGISIDSVSINGNIGNIQLIEGSNYDTSVGFMNLTIAQNNLLKDIAGNLVANISNAIITDKAKPVLVKSEYFDTNKNYKIDTVHLTFSENVIGFNSGDFSTTGITKNGGSMVGQNISLSILETTDDNDTGKDAQISFNTGNLKDSSNNFVSSISNKSIQDRVSPKLLSIETKDNNANGKIDTIALSYSEAVNDDFNSFIGEVEGYTISSYSKSSASIININLEEAVNPDSGITPFVSVHSNTSLQDNGGNKIEAFKHQQSNDKVGPVIIGAKYDSNTHKISFDYSEVINTNDLIASNIILNNAGTYTITAIDTINKTISLSGENIIYGNTSISFKAGSIRDTKGNSQSGNIFVKISPPIIINEVMISNNSNNNYIELKNLSDNNVNIGGFKIAGITIPNGVTMSASGHYLITKDTKTNSIVNVNPNLVNNNLNIAGNTISLNNGSIDIDSAPISNYIGDKNTPKSMERNAIVGDGSNIANWHIAQVSNGFDSTASFGTPNTYNIHDVSAPIIGNYFPQDNQLLATSGKNISFEYADNLGGLGVNTSSDSLKIYKWNNITSTWGNDISGIYVDMAGKNIGTGSAIYDYIKPLPYGKYRIDFSISDNADNQVQKSILYYVDEIEFSIDKQQIDMGFLSTGMNSFASQELIISIKTLGAGFKIDMNKIGNLSYNGYSIVDYNGAHGFGFNQYKNGYDGSITSIGNNVNIASQGQNINIIGEKNTYIYKIKYGAKIDEMQGAGTYSVKPNYSVLLDY